MPIAQHGGAAVDRGRQHQTGPQDHPVHGAAHQIVLGLRLAARERRRALARGAERGNVDHAAHGAALAGGEQRGGGGDMHALHVVARAVLQDADAIDHDIIAVDQGKPVARQRQVAEIGLDPARERRAAARRSERAAGAGHLMAVAVQPRQARSADQPIGSDYQHAHVQLQSSLRIAANRST